MSQLHYIYLIPGFFGFADLGGITYFHHVREILTSLLRPMGIEPQIFYVDTHPTASIRKRAYRLYEQIVDTAVEEDAPIHLIGHSTGGLDARLLVTPSASLLNEVDTEPYASRVKSVVTIATPHYGTPMASFFDGLLGQKLLYLLSMGTVYALRFGKFPLATMFQIIGVLSKLDDRLGLENTILDQFYENLFADFEHGHMDEITAFLESVRTEQALLGQLTPGGIDLLNAAAEDREGTRYGCVITQAREPKLEVIREIGLDPYRQGSHLIYHFLWWIVSKVYPYPQGTDAQKQAMTRAFGQLPDVRANDGVVPTWSQIHGEVIHACWADHLDVCGHFTDPAHDPPHVDWLSSGTGYSRLKFTHLWEDIVDYIAAP